MSIYGIILSSICLLDLLVTIIGLKTSFIVKEINPLLAWAIDLAGIWGLWIAKIMLNALCVGILEYSYKNRFNLRFTTPIRIKRFYITAIILYIFVLTLGQIVFLYFPGLILK